MFRPQGHNRPPFPPKIPGTDLRSDRVPMAVIYRPARSAMTSGPRERSWVLEFEPARPPSREPLMGWTSGDDPFRPIRLVFPDRDSAVSFAERQDWRYVVREDSSSYPARPGQRHTAHRLYKAADAPGAYRIPGDVRPVSNHRLHRGVDVQNTSDLSQRSDNYNQDPVIEADLESFPASDPPAWTGVTISSRTSR